MLLREQLNFNLLHSDLQNLPPTASSECITIQKSCHWRLFLHTLVYKKVPQRILLLYAEDSSHTIFHPRKNFY